MLVTLWQLLTIVTAKKQQQQKKTQSQDLWHLRHWLQFLQLRTWIHDNLCYLTIKSDTGQHSQFLRCLLHFTPFFGNQQWKVKVESISYSVLIIFYLKNSSLKTTRRNNDAADFLHLPAAFICIILRRHNFLCQKEIAEALSFLCFKQKLKVKIDTFRIRIKKTTQDISLFFALERETSKPPVLWSSP